MAMVKKIKTEPESVGYADFEDSFALGTDLAPDSLLNFNLDAYKSPSSGKHTSSPAQEATRARITTCETQLKKLYKQKATGKIDNKGVMQIRCLEDDIRKAQAKLRRLLNEAERQRRRRERIRSGITASASSAVPGGASSSSSKMMMIVRGSGGGRHSYDGLPTIISYGTQQSELVTSGPHDDGVMSALKQCSKFDDFVKELNTLGFALNRVEEENPVVYDVPEDNEDLPNGNVEVQVELIEGEAALEQTMTVIEDDGEVKEIKPEPLSPSPSSPIAEVPPKEDRLKGNSSNISSDPPPKSPPTPASVKVFAAEYARKHAQCLREYQQQYQDWYERQVESQQQWEDNFVREQMDLAKTMLESVTSTFLQGMQQIMQNVMTNASIRRPMQPFVPTFSTRPGPDINGLALVPADIPLFIHADPTPSGGPRVLSTRSLGEDQ